MLTLKGLSLLAFICVSWLGCSSRWVPIRPVSMAINPGCQELAFEKLLKQVRSMGYAVVEDDEKRGFLKIRAKLDGDIVGGYGRIVIRVSFFAFQVKEQIIPVSVSGYHVKRGGTVWHQHLDDELTALLAALNNKLRELPARCEVQGVPASRPMQESI